MATFKIVLKKEKIDAQGMAPVYLRITVNRKTRYTALNVKVLPKNWDSEGEKVKRGHPNSSRVNHYLAHKKSEAMNSVRETEIKEGRISADKAKAAVRGEDSISFIDFAEGYLQRMLASERIASHDKANAVVSKIKEYLNGKDLMLEEVNVSWLRSYDSYLRLVKKNKNNTVYSNMKVIRAILNQAIDEDLLRYENNPFHRYKLKWKKVEKVFLTEDEIKRLEELELSEEPKLELYRDLFIFACYVGGIRVSDLMTLKQANFTGTHILRMTQKTDDTISVMVPKKGLEILKKYILEDSKANDFLFPVLESGFDDYDPVKKFNEKKNKTAQINKGLKTLADLAGIEKIVSTHTARHSFATRALSIGVEVENLAKLMGHTKISQTLEYAKIVNERLDDDMSKFNDN